MDFVILGKTAQSPVREEFVRVEHPLQDPSQLGVVDDGEKVVTRSVPAGREAEVAHDVLLVTQKPIEPLTEPWQGSDRLLFQALHREEGNQPDQRADSEPLEAVIWEAQNVVKEPVLFVPELVMATAMFVIAAPT